MGHSWLGWLLLAHVAATLYMTGLIWFVQIVHYPLFAAVDRSVFPAYERRHASSTTWVVAPPMLLELTSWGHLVAWRPGELSAGSLLFGGLLLAVIWLSTFLIQVPCHNRLTSGFDAVVHRRLVVSNWLRTAAWTARSALLLETVAALLK